MKNEIKTIIILTVIIVLLVGFIIFRELNQRAKNREYQNNIEQLETTTTELRNTNTELGKENERIRTELIGVESNYTGLEKKYTESMEIIRELENARSKLTKENQGFGKDLAELEKLLSEFFDF